MNEPLLQIDHLTKAYGETTILKDVSFSVGQGEVVVIIGPSGCGKSTLLRCINALEPIQGGQVRFFLCQGGYTTQQQANAHQQSQHFFHPIASFPNGLRFDYTIPGAP